MDQVPAVKKRDTRKKRESILNGAVQVFTEMGYDHASMDRIAETAGVSKRTVYNHFQNKDHLFQAVIAKFLAEQLSLKQIPYAPGQPLEEQLTAFARAELFLINSPSRLGLSRVLTSVFIRDIDYARRTREQYASPHAPFIQWLIAAHEDKQLHVDNPPLAASVFYAMIEGALTWPALFQQELDEARIKPLLDELLRTFLQRYRKESVENRR
ncbi:TetR/AcrR family transcriptional regulator [Paenibacillus athensensis]|uniref:HTH tetR-type domain-containing protein n=1 Tax=Paenibacillus athensensis TaxID=1967502 RepID=A0A4Y8Q9G1_9BACL|nr:TetR/AcrR family transcriptional regulator [Paenibacillus athensensis]MCD1260012.1 TetR/AcrR family transcriptional regulator [Paenibacillus athensensis]